MPRIEPSSVPVRTGTIYPPPYDALVAGRSSLRLGDAGGMTQFGVSLVTLPPGAASSMRHCHEAEDEFVMITEGTCILVTGAGETELVPGDCAAFPAGDGDAHHFQNRSAAAARFLVIGPRAPREVVYYPNQGLKVVQEAGKSTFYHDDGRPLATD